MLVEQLRSIDNQNPILVKNGEEQITWSRSSDSSGIPKDVIRVRNPQQHILDSAPQLLVIAVQDKLKDNNGSLQVFTEVNITGTNIAGPTHTRTTLIQEVSPTPTELFKVTIRFNGENMQSATVKLSDSIAAFVQRNGEFNADHMNDSKDRELLSVLTNCISAASHYISEISK